MPSFACAERRALGARGTTSLEFALVGAMLVSLLLGGIEASRYFFTLQSLRAATAEAVRLVLLRGSQNLNGGGSACTNLAGTLGGVTAKVPYLSTASLQVTMSGCATSGGVTTVSVSVQLPFTFNLPLFGPRARTLSEQAQAVFN